MSSDEPPRYDGPRALAAALTAFARASAADARWDREGLRDDAEYRERYRAALATAAQAFSVEAFDALVEQAETLATPALVGAEGERPESTFVSSEASLAQCFDALRAHVRARQDALATELAAE